MRSEEIWDHKLGRVLAVVSFIGDQNMGVVKGQDGAVQHGTEDVGGGQAGGVLDYQDVSHTNQLLEKRGRELKEGWTS